MKQQIIIAGAVIIIATLFAWQIIYQINQHIDSTFAGAQFNTAISAHCEALTGSPKWGTQFQSATSTVGLIGCLNK